MGVLGDMIRLVRDTTKDSLEECGLDEVKDEKVIRSKSMGGRQWSKRFMTSGKAGLRKNGMTIIRL